MRIITISREFGSGGRELGKRLADHLGYDYYDSEIIAAVASKSGMDTGYVEKTLNNHQWQNYRFSFRGTLGSAPYLKASQVDLLVLQKKVIEDIAGMGEDFVIVGRNADHILREYHPFSVFVCAQTDAKIRRCMERARPEENLGEKELIRKMRQIDENRTKTRELMNGPAWGRRDAYHMIINTTDWDIKELVPVTAGFAECWFEKKLNSR